MIQSIIVSGLLAFLNSGYASAQGLPPPPTSLDAVLEATQLTLSSGLLGGVLIVAGLLMCFAGKRFFKLFLSIVGLAAGAMAGFLAMGYITDIATIPNAVVVTYVVAGILGLICAAACLYLWKIGVYVGAGLGGYSLVVYVLSLKVGGVIESQIGRQAALVIGAGLGVVAAMFLEDIAIAVASSMTGSLSTMCGVDCYINTGFRAQIYDQAVRRTFQVPEVNSHMYFMFAATLALAVCGMVVQLIAPSKGYGRAR